MPAHKSRSGIRVPVRVEHLMRLSDLTLVLYGTDVPPGQLLTQDQVRHCIVTSLQNEGHVLIARVRNKVRADRLIDKDRAEERLRWARAMVLKTYRRDFKNFSDELAAFEAAALS